jgi:hypothetical protein
VEELNKLGSYLNLKQSHSNCLPDGSSLGFSSKVEVDKFCVVVFDFIYEALAVDTCRYIALNRMNFMF